MKRLSLFLLLIPVVLIATKVEVYFNGLFKIYYNTGVYTLDWLYEFVSKQREKFGLKTDWGYVKRLKEAIDTASEMTGIDPFLIIAMISVETSFRNVRGMAGEMGLMQIKPETARFVHEVFDLPLPREGWGQLLWDYQLNVIYGAHYLKYLLDKFGDLRKAVEYYNAGKNKEVYADKIFLLYNSLKSGS